MKANIFYKVLKSGVVLSFALLISKNPLAADPPVNKNLPSIVDSITIVMKEKYGYDLKIDPSLKNGCINYYKEIKGASVNPVSGQGHIHTSAEFTMDFYDLVPHSFFYELVEETIEEPQFKEYFSIYKPTKIWVEEVLVGDKCYFIVSLD